MTFYNEKRNNVEENFVNQGYVGNQVFVKCVEAIKVENIKEEISVEERAKDSLSIKQNDETIKEDIKEEESVEDAL